MSTEPAAGRPNLPAGYGLAADGPTLPWSWAEERLAAARNYWVATVSPGARPHVAPVWGIWTEGAFYFSTDAASRKGRNLTANPALSVHLESGDQVVVLEGTAHAVTDQTHLEALDRLYRAKYDVSMLAIPNAAILVTKVQPVVAFGWLESDFVHATRWQIG